MSDAPDGTTSVQEELSAELLLLAIRAFLDSCGGPPGGQASVARMWKARESMLYAALSAEGHINRFLFENVAIRDAEALDRLSTVDKYVVVPQLVVGKQMFDRGAEPLQRIARLLARRNELAHPKPRRRVVPAFDLRDVVAWTGPAFEIYNPVEACESLMAVARAAAALDGVEARPASGPQPPTRYLLDNRAELLGMAANAMKKSAPTAEEISASERRIIEMLIEKLGSPAAEPDGDLRGSS